MAIKFWDRLKLKNGDIVKFVPPEPNGSRLGGITQEQRQKIGAHDSTKQDKLTLAYDSQGLLKSVDGKDISADKNHAGKTLASTDDVPSKITDLTDASRVSTLESDMTSVKSGKQDTISDLATIRSGAALGATAVQDISGKQDVISDLSTIRSNASDVPQAKQDIVSLKENIATLDRTVEKLDDSADGNLYGTRSVTATGSQTAPADALNRAVVTSCAGADTVRVHSKNMLNLYGDWVKNSAYYELPIDIPNGSYVLSMDRNLCNKKMNPLDGTYVFCINKRGLTSAWHAGSAAYFGHTGNTSTSFTSTVYTFSVIQPVSMYAYFNGAQDANKSEIIKTFFGSIQIESGSTATARKPYFANDYAVTRAWDGVISINDGALIEYLTDDEVVSIDNTVVYTVKKQVAHASDIATLNTALTTLGNSKQDTLVSGTNIKTVNNQSLLGEGNIVIEGGGGSGQSFQTIYTDTLEDDVADLLIKFLDASNNVMKLSKVVVAIQFPSSGITATRLVVNFFARFKYSGDTTDDNAFGNYDYLYNLFDNAITNNSFTHIYFDAESGGLPMMTWIATKSYTSKTVCSPTLVIPSDNSLRNYVRGLKIRSNSTTQLIPAGTKIVVYGAVMNQ